MGQCTLATLNIKVATEPMPGQERSHPTSGFLLALPLLASKQDLYTSN